MTPHNPIDDASFFVTMTQGSLPPGTTSAGGLVDAHPPLAGTFISPNQVRQIQAMFGTPAHIYDLGTLKHRARLAQDMPSAFGHTVRFAIKSCPNIAILRIFDRLGLQFDASSGREVQRALSAGIDPRRILLTAQEVPPDLEELVQLGVRFNATSLHQLELYGALFPGREVTVRFNPGLGSGHSRRTSVGGPTASFGIWHTRIADVVAIQAAYKLRIVRLHSHIGSGADPGIWQQCAARTLNLARSFPEVNTVNLGGGFQVGRMPDDADTDLSAAGAAIAEQFRLFRAHDPARRALRLEIEPGAFLVARAGVIISTVIDVKDTGQEGYRFIVVDSGMTDILRPSLYGAQHPIWVVPRDGEIRRQARYIVVGHCCESGDILTPAPGNPEGLLPRLLAVPRIGDALVIGATGAYGASLSATNYNSFPRSQELLLTPAGEIHVIRQPQTMAAIIGDERVPDLDPWLPSELPA